MCPQLPDITGTCFNKDQGIKFMILLHLGTQYTARSFSNAQFIIIYYHILKLFKRSPEPRLKISMRSPGMLGVGHFFNWVTTWSIFLNDEIYFTRLIFHQKNVALLKLCSIFFTRFSGPLRNFFVIGLQIFHFFLTKFEIFSDLLRLQITSNGRFGFCNRGRIVRFWELFSHLLKFIRKISHPQKFATNDYPVVKMTDPL